MVRTLSKHIGKYKWATILTPCMMVLEVLMEVLIPYVIARLIDQGIEAGNMEKIWQYGFIMLVMACFSLLFGSLGGIFAANASTGFASNLREAMYRKIQEYSFSNIDKFSTAGLVTRMTTDVSNVQMAFQMLTRIAVRAPMTLVISIIMCFTIDYKLSLVFVVALCILSLSLFFIVSRTMKLFKEAFKRYDDVNASVQENVTAIRVVKAYVREKYENEKFAVAAGNLYKLFTNAEIMIALNNPIMMTVIYGSIIALSWFGAQFIVGGTLTTGELTSMFSYVISVLSSLMMLSMIFVMLTMSIASANRITEILVETPSIMNPENPIMEVKSGEIQFDNVHFSYAHGAEEEILTGIDLTIHDGETIGIIGGTGCGKSSFVNLISRLYDVDQGSVSVGGVDVRDYDLEVIRNEVAVVLQKNVLFSGTILENLRWGNEDATLEECIEVCKMACADEFIENMPEKYDSWIEQGGANVSGGQKQRLCIARALLKHPKVLILDDSTSAVDTATDAHIREAFAKKIPGTTKIIIAQRISSVQYADRIIVMEDGHIDGFDTHENLLASNKIYQEIYETQTKGGGDFDETISERGKEEKIWQNQNQ